MQLSCANLRFAFFANHNMCNVYQEIFFAIFDINCEFWYSLHFEIMQYIPKSIRITKFCLNCAISYNLHFEIMQCIFCEYGMWYMTMLVSTFIE